MIRANLRRMVSLPLAVLDQSHPLASPWPRAQFGAYVPPSPAQGRRRGLPIHRHRLDNSWVPSGNRTENLCNRSPWTAVLKHRVVANGMALELSG